MSIPLIGKQPDGICIICKGVLTPDHNHIYVDEKDYQVLLAVSQIALRTGAVLITDQGLIPAYPPMPPGKMWHPATITHVGTHDDCSMEIPHHHCVGRETDILYDDLDENSPDEG